MRYTDFYNEFQVLIDNVSHDPDTPRRLSNLARLQEDVTKAFIAARNEAAYETRLEHPMGEACRLSDIGPDKIKYWTRRHMKKHGLSGGLKRIKHVDLSGAVDISTVRGEQPPTGP